MRGCAYYDRDEERGGHRVLLPVLAFSLMIHAALLAAVQGLGTGVRHLPDEGIINVVVTHLEKPEKQPAPEPPVPKPATSRPVVLPVSPPQASQKAVPAPVAEAPVQAAPAPIETPPAVHTSVISPEQALGGLGAPVQAKPAATTRQETRPPAPSVTASVARPAPSSPACPCRKADLAPLRASYQDVLRALIEKYKEYPLFARKARVQGAVMIRCVLARTGEVRSMIVSRSSGSSMLDEAAARAVKSVGKFPPPPSEIEGPEVTFEVPVAFRLTKE